MKTSLEDRMKIYYEQNTCTKLPENVPIILRLDGRAFHTLTRGLDKPFDLKFIDLMNKIALDLCDNEIQNAKMAYIQSDEISILIYAGVFSSSWFNNDVQKMTSISASRASCTATIHNNELEIFKNKKPIMFDSRVFIIPEKEVCNYFIWRQRDWERNSLQMLARKYYSQAHLQNKNNSDMHEMIFNKDDNWNALSTFLRRGRCIIPTTKKINVTKKETNGMFEGEVERNFWTVDNNIPIFTKDRNYIEKYLNIEE